MVAFRREAFVAQGGPYGGNGGNGGAIFFEADESINSLVGFRKKVHHRAEPGGNGGGKRMQGQNGRDRVVLVPPGTVIRDSRTGETLAEMFAHGHREMVIPGGRGGRGNASFKTAKNKAPQIAENGEEGIEYWVEMELKLVADVGIIGVPNAGKSTLLKREQRKAQDRRLPVPRPSSQTSAWSSETSSAWCSRTFPAYWRAQARASVWGSSSSGTSSARACSCTCWTARRRTCWTSTTPSATRSSSSTLRSGRSPSSSR